MSTPAARARPWHTLLRGLLVCLFFMHSAFADDLQDAASLVKRGQMAQALDIVNKALAGNPKDPLGRFLKAVILADQNKSAEAIDLFSRLNQENPDWPEPLNNLAVIYAAQGNFEKARQSLEASIRTHPSYATAYRNLQLVYSTLATQAYNQALQIDRNAGATANLVLVREMTSRNVPQPALAVAKSDPPRPDQGRETVRTTPLPRDPTTTVDAGASVKAEPTVASRATKKGQDASPAAGAPAANRQGVDPSEEITKVLKAWASAWSGKDVKTYLSFYARDFKPPSGESRAEWAKSRTARIQAPRHIAVSVDSPRVSFLSDDLANVSFRQSYRSDRTNLVSTKTLVMARSGGKWLIRQERAGN